MRIATLNAPFRYGADPSQWITVPPQGYGGIQWVVSHLIDGFLETGNEVLLLGAPGSPPRPGLTVLPAIDAPSVATTLAEHAVDVVHDHSDGVMLPPYLALPTVGTHHLTGVPAVPVNCIYVSEAQRRQAGSLHAPVIRLPVNADHCEFSIAKKDYLLYIGRVSRHKGVHEAAAFAAAAGLPLKVAGPAWEKGYFNVLVGQFPHTVDYIGEVGPQQRAQLIAHARALLVLSQPVKGPFGTEWCEPGSTVVAEAAASGTPVIASDNGCLPEIVPRVGAVLNSGNNVTASEAERLLAILPSADELRNVALEQWGHVRIAEQYLRHFARAMRDDNWT
ncbi:glycosyltransferase [Streptomyces sp. NPDC088141]|uniref:glycosyltransferase n=1 Tax=Streptomyces sp. NPDC088141 TaxID=3155179 RepID=UPI003417728F